MKLTVLATVAGVCVGLGASLTSYAAPKRPVPEAAAYLAELEKRGLMDATLGTPARLTAEVLAADTDLVAGNVAQAAARLYAVVEGPRWQDLSDADDFQDAEYRLAVALQRGASFDTARRYFLRALGRGPKGVFYLPALRGFVDVCIEGQTLRSCVEESDRVGASDMNEELAYLRGRAAFEGVSPDPQMKAEDELARVTPKSRFYSSAIYLRGILRVKQRDWKGASDALCVVADVKDGDSIRFFIDGRFYALRDLARIGLGRVAHEEGRYDDAFYHYFLIPQDSSRLPEALFEAAWSSLARKEYDLGARLIDAFMESFPRSPRAAEAKLLRATLLVKTCRFRLAEKTLVDFIQQHEPLIATIDRALGDPATRQDLAEKLLARELAKEEVDLARKKAMGARPAGSAPPPPPPPAPAPTTVEGRLAELLQLDPRFFRLQSVLRGLRAGTTEAGFTERSWSDLESRVSGTKVQTVDRGLGPQQLLVAAHALGSEVTRLRTANTQAQKAAKATHQAADLSPVQPFEERRQALLSSLEKALGSDGSSDAGAQTGLLPMIRADRDRSTELKLRAARLDGKINRAAGQLLEQSLAEARGQLEDLLRRARLGQIDAVVGEKRRIEKQIENLAAGRFPPELFGKLHLEGLIGDDEVYWPPEQEIWLDEYENYK